MYLRNGLDKVEKQGEHWQALASLHSLPAAPAGHWEGFRPIILPGASSYTRNALG